MDEDDQETTKLIVVLQLRTKTLRTRVISEVLVQWLGSPPEDATWESLQQLQLIFPHLVGKVL